MSQPLTKSDLSRHLTRLRAGIEASFRGHTRDLIEHFNRGQGAQNERLDRIGERLDAMETTLDAIMETLATRKEVRALVRELKAQGIALDESRIFAA